VQIVKYSLSDLVVGFPPGISEHPSTDSALGLPGTISKTLLGHTLGDRLLQKGTLACETLLAFACSTEVLSKSPHECDASRRDAEQESTLVLQQSLVEAWPH